MTEYDKRQLEAARMDRIMTKLKESNKGKKRISFKIGAKNAFGTASPSKMNGKKHGRSGL